MEKISAQDFFERFITAVEGDITKATTAYRESEDWTKYIYDITETILKEEFGLEIGKEYLRIDMIGWSGYEKWKTSEEKNVGSKNCSNDSNDNPGLNEHNWNLEIAIEFENEPKQWMDEVIKLCHIKCGLKVVIGYTHYENRDTMDKEKLNFVAKHMETLKYGRLGDNEAFMIILGNCGEPKLDYQKMEDMDFRAYILHGEFKKLVIS